MFEPSYCPNPACSAHREPAGKFWYRSGTYAAKCRPDPVPCFRCRVCGRRFSSQTFRADYRDHRPELNAEVLQRLLRGTALRRSARELGLSRRATQHKFRKIARRLAELRGSSQPVTRVAEDDALPSTRAEAEQLWDWVNRSRARRR